jgi:multiple sugar transport system substrate-binding protein
MLTTTKASRSRRRAMRAVASAAVFALVISACGDDDGEDLPDDVDHVDDVDDAADAATDDEIDDDRDPVELRFAWWGADDRHERYLEVIDLYEERNPHVTITPEFGEIGSVTDRIATQVAGGNPPDVFWVGGDDRLTFADRGVLLDLNPYVEDGTIDISGFEEADIEQGTVNGQLISLVHGFQSAGVFSNLRVLEEVGVSLPTVPDTVTWDEFHEIALAVSDHYGDGFWGADDISFTHQGHFNIFARQHGEQLWSEDGGLGFSPETLTAWWEMWSDLRESGAVTPADVVLEDDAFFEGAAMIRGLAGIHIRNTNQMLQLQTLSDDPLEVHLAPTIDDPEPGYLTIDPNWVTASGTTEHPDEAAAFIDFLVNDPDRALIVETTIGAPGTATLRDHILDHISEPERRFVAHIDFEAQSERFPAIPGPPGAGDVNGLLSQTAEEIALGQLDIPTGVERVFEEGPQLLEDAAR